MRPYAQRDSASPIWDLVCGLPSPKREARLIMALQAYVDDSGGTDINQHRYFVLGGLIADASRWADFASDWQAVLDIEPRLEYFKMSEASYLTKQFAMRRGWTKHLRDERVNSLVEVIRSYAIFRISVSLDKVEFRDRVASIKIPNPLLTAKDPYYFAFHTLVLGLPLRQAMRVAALPDGGKIDFIFDEQGKTGLRASDAWERLKSNILPKFQMEGVPNILPYLGSPPIYRDEKTFLPLQAADLYVWHVRKHRERNRVLIAPPLPRLSRISEIPGDDIVYEGVDFISVRRDILKSIAQFGGPSGNTP